MKEVAEKENLDDVIENLMKLVTYMLNVNEMRYNFVLGWEFQNMFENQREEQLFLRGFKLSSNSI